MHLNPVFISGNSSYVVNTSATQASSPSERIQQVAQNPMRELSQKKNPQKATLQEQKLKESIKKAKELLCHLKNLSDQTTCIDGILTLLNSHENSTINKKTIKIRSQVTEELTMLKAVLSTKMKDFNAAPRSVQVVLNLAKRELEDIPNLLDEINKLSHLVGEDDDRNAWDNLTIKIVGEFNDLCDKVVAREERLKKIADQLSIKETVLLTKKIEKKAQLIKSKASDSYQILSTQPEKTIQPSKKGKTKLFPTPGSYEDLTYMLEYKPVNIGYND